MPKQKKMWDNILTVIMTLLSLLWIYPIVLILLNSLKVEGTFTTSTVFKLPTAETFAGLSNYVYGVTKMGFLSSMSRTYHLTGFQEPRKRLRILFLVIIVISPAIAKGEFLAQVTRIQFFLRQTVKVIG